MIGKFFLLSSYWNYYPMLHSVILEKVFAVCVGGGFIISLIFFNLTVFFHFHWVLCRWWVCCLRGGERVWILLSLRVRTTCLLLSCANLLKPRREQPPAEELAQFWPSANKNCSEQGNCNCIINYLIMAAGETFFYTSKIPLGLACSEM